MGYENAKSTKLLASNCCVCARLLRDAKSVELGIGPVCRSRYGYDLDVSEDARVQANVLVYTVARTQEMSADQYVTLLSLGFSVLANKLKDRLLESAGQVTVTTEGTRWLIVDAPYNADALPAWRRIGTWESATKTRRVAVSNKAKLWALLQEFHNGCELTSDKGITLIGSNKPPQAAEEEDLGNQAEAQMAVEQAAEESESNLAAVEVPSRRKLAAQLELPNVPPKCISRNCHNGWIWHNNSEYPCSACSARGDYFRNVNKQEEVKEAKQAQMDPEDEQDDSWTDGPPPGSWAATARMMAAGDDSGFDWDSWKDQMKEGQY